MSRSMPSPLTPYRRWLLVGTLFAAVLGGSLVAVEPVEAAVPETKRVALVDLQRVLLETAQGKAAKQDLEDELAKSEAKLKRKAEDLQKQLEDLQSKAKIMSEDQLMRRQQELAIKDQELQALYAELGEDISTKEALLMEKIYKNTQTVVAAIAKEEGIQIVLVKSELTVLYANPQLDITNKVIVAYDKKFK
jgi:outer membrane protein